MLHKSQNTKCLISAIEFRFNATNMGYIYMLECMKGKQNKNMHIL
jgi:hypothetical protein